MAKWSGCCFCAREIGAGCSGWKIHRGILRPQFSCNPRREIGGSNSSRDNQLQCYSPKGFALQNILVQTGAAMLAQANVISQSALRLRGLRLAVTFNFPFMPKAASMPPCVFALTRLLSVRLECFHGAQLLEDFL